MFLASSSDVLNISLAIAVLGLTILIGWILVYFILIIKRVVRILETVERSAERVTDFVAAAKEKLESSANYLSILMLGIKEAINFVADKRSAKKASNKKKDSADD